MIRSSDLLHLIVQRSQDTEDVRRGHAISLPVSSPLQHSRAFSFSFLSRLVSSPATVTAKISNLLAAVNR